MLLSTSSSQVTMRATERLLLMNLVDEPVLVREHRCAGGLELEAGGVGAIGPALVAMRRGPAASATGRAGPARTRPGRRRRSMTWTTRRTGGPSTWTLTPVAHRPARGHRRTREYSTGPSRDDFELLHGKTRSAVRQGAEGVQLESGA